MELWRTFLPLNGWIDNEDSRTLTLSRGARLAGGLQKVDIKLHSDDIERFLEPYSYACEYYG